MRKANLIETWRIRLFETPPVVDRHVYNVFTMWNKFLINQHKGPACHTNAVLKVTDKLQICEIRCLLLGYGL